MTSFTATDMYQIKGRGPCITRHVDDSHAARDAGELFEAGEEIVCGDLRAKITGIMHYCCLGPTGESQLALMLEGVTLDQLESGQKWVKADG